MTATTQTTSPMSLASFALPVGLSRRPSDNLRRSTLGEGTAGTAALQTLSELPPATDEEAQAATPVVLGLLPADVEHLHGLAKCVAAARADLVQAEAALAAAEKAAGTLSYHERRAGEVAARAYAHNGRGKVEAGDVAQAIDVARAAVAAVPVLLQSRDAARDRVGDCRGALHRATVVALQAALKRGAEEYSRVTLELTRVVASLSATLNALPSRQSSDLGVAWHGFMLSTLRVPALPDFGHVDRSSVDSNFRPTLLCHDHPRLTLHATAAQGWLDRQLRDALAPSGWPPRALLG